MPSYTPCSQIIGKGTYEIKEDLKEKFGAIAYTDLLFHGGTATKSAWVLPVKAQTEETGTLADFLRGLGCEVTEVDLDEDEEEDDDGEEDEEGFIENEADESDKDEDEDEDEDEDA